MNPARYLVSTKPHGGTSGENFDGIPPPETLPHAVVTAIGVRRELNIVNITMYYGTGDLSVISHGNTQENETKFPLAASEYVTMIEGSVTAGAISQLTFVTNKRILGTVGVVVGGACKCVWSVADQVPSHLAHRMGLLYFTGSLVRGDIRSLAPVFADYPCEEVNAKYESIRSPESHIQLHVSEPARDPALLSSFALRLMAPTVTIVAGAQSTEYHVSEAILCTLPFFEACLQGQFKEASEKTVKMPDDDADAVASLIEFLYTGSYTYTYDSELTGLQAGSAGRILDVPISDLRQALFHLTVHTLACKYDCQALARVAKQNLRVVTREVDAIGFIQVCEAMYRDGLQISDLGDAEEGVVFKERITAWVISLCTGHREQLVKATTKYPNLACDLLLFVTRPSE